MNSPHFMTIGSFKKYKFAFFLFFFLLTGTPAVFADSHDTVLLQQALQDTLDKALKDYHIPGVVLALRTPEKETVYCQAGYADLENKKRMSLDLFFQIGSLTKTFTATAVLQLKDSGLLKLSDSVEKYFPGLLRQGDTISIRNLLQMRSGLAHYENNPEFMNILETHPHQQFAPEKLVGYADAYLYSPDEKFDYNNVNYIILGMLIEKLSNKSYHEAVTNMILTPLKLQNTIVPEPQADPVMPRPYAKGYLNQENTVTNYSTYYTRSWAWSAGNMISTIGDMLEWVGFLLDGALLKEDTRQERFAFLPCGKPEELSYGMGVTAIDNGAVGHSGNYNFIYTAGGYRYKGYDISILCNGQNAGGGLETQAKNIIAQVFDKLDHMDKK